jgi:hypothetical protein
MAPTPFKPKGPTFSHVSLLSFVQPAPLPRAALCHHPTPLAPVASLFVGTVPAGRPPRMRPPVGIVFSI